MYVKTSGTISADAGNNGNDGCGCYTPFNSPVDIHMKNFITT